MGVVMAATILSLLLYVAYLARPRSVRVAQSQNFLCVWSALHHEDLSCKHLPEHALRDRFGSPYCSWRFRLVDTLEQVYYPVSAAEVPWYYPEYHLWAGRPHWAFCFDRSHPRDPSLHMTMCAVTGSGTAFDPGQATRLEDLPDDVILLIEVAKSDVHWMEPADLQIGQVTPELAQGTDGSGFFVAFADGAVWFLDRATPVERVEKFFTVQGARDHDRESLLGPFCRLRDAR